jgi:septal ring factor EnvC (AmiA/AmiB activator)
MFPNEKDLTLEVLKKLDEVKDRIHCIELDQARRLGNIDKILAEQEKNLEFHMKRSDSLEQQVKVMEQEVKPVLDSLRSVKILFTILAAIVTLSNIWLKFS